MRLLNRQGYYYDVINLYVTKMSTIVHGGTVNTKGFFSTTDQNA